LEWKNDGVMDDKSGDDDTGEVRWSWRSETQCQQHSVLISLLPQSITGYIANPGLNKSYLSQIRYCRTVD